MGALDEVGSEFMKMLLILGAILLGIGAWLLFSVSMWLLVFVVLLVAVGYWFLKNQFGGR